MEKNREIKRKTNYWFNRLYGHILYYSNYILNSYNLPLEQNDLLNECLMTINQSIAKNEEVNFSFLASACKNAINNLVKVYSSNKHKILNFAEFEDDEEQTFDPPFEQNMELERLQTEIKMKIKMTNIEKSVFEMMFLDTNSPWKVMRELKIGKTTLDKSLNSLKTKLFNIIC